MNVALFENDIFEYRTHKYRALKFKVGKVLVIRMDQPNPLPEDLDTEVLTPSGKSDGIRILDLPEFNRTPLSSAENVVLREKRWRRIEALVNEDRVLDPSTRASAINEHAKNIGVSRKTLLSNLRMWWLGGQTRDALLGRYDQCGKILEDTDGCHSVKLSGRRGEAVYIFAPTSVMARGRRPTYGNHLPYPISSALREKLIQIAKNYYQKDETISVRALTDKVLTELFCILDDKGVPLGSNDGKRAVLRAKGQRPSVDQVRRIVDKALAISESRAGRTSPHEFENNHAPSTGSVKDDCIGPGDVFEIDATFIDLWIVAIANSQKIIGKATLYLVIDRDSRLITGFHISLENPSWGEAKLAVLSVACDWEAVCKRLKVHYDSADWPAKGVMPNRFVGDRAEMLSYASDVLCSGLEISVTNPPARRGNRKPVVESGFKTTHVALKDMAPGYEPPKNPRSRSGIHYDKDACLNLDKLAAIFLEIVIHHNNTPKAGYLLSPDEVFSEFQPTPVAIWNRSVQNRMGLGRRYHYSHLRARLAPTDTAQVHVDGVRFRGCTYEFAEAHWGDWMTRASIYGQFAVVVTYVESLVDTISIADPRDKSRTYTGTLTPKARHFSGYSFVEVKAYTRLLAKLRHEGGDISQEARVALRRKIEAKTKPTHKAMKADTKGQTLGSRHGNSEAIRTAESKARRRHTHDPAGDGIPYLPDSEANTGHEPQQTHATKVVNLDSVRKTTEGSKATSGGALPLAMQPSSEPKPASRSLQSAHPSFANHLLDLLK